MDFFIWNLVGFFPRRKDNATLVLDWDGAVSNVAVGKWSQVENVKSVAIGDRDGRRVERRTDRSTVIGTRDASDRGSRRGRIRSVVPGRITRTAEAVARRRVGQLGSPG